MAKTRTSFYLLSGHTQVHEELEQALARLTKRPRALLFSTGYMANLAVLSSLLEAGDTVIHDRLNHASLIDGGLLANCRFMRYQHANMLHLVQRLNRAKGHRLIASDGVFSMDGDVAPITDLAQISYKHGALLMIDDAHGIGVLGKHGAGSLEEANVTVKEVPILMGTLGKALGTSGAFVAGSEELIEYLIQFSRPYIYTTASSPAIAAASLAALELLDVVVGDNARTMWLAQQLRNQGFLVSAIRPPTVPEHSARLRITLTADHQPEQITALLNALVELWGEYL